VSGYYLPLDCIDVQDPVLAIIHCHKNAQHEEAENGGRETLL
jgi:hypothetical protein